jgi:SHS2 domain-containing protein
VGVNRVFSYPEGGPAADLLVEAKGESLGVAFANLALGMFNAMTPIAEVKAKEEFIIEAEGTDLESLLFNMMDEFLYINDTEFLVPSEIIVDLDSRNFKVVAKCRGERISRETHKVGLAIKAVTYHMMSIERLDDEWRVQVVFDT